MRKGRTVGGYISPYAQADTSVISGVAVEVSRETRGARRRSGFARVNTNANRKNGGGASSANRKPEELAGSQRTIPPTTAGVRNRDDWGITLPRQHMTATRKRHDRDGTGPKSGKIKRRGKGADAPQTRLESEHERCREVERTRIERRNLSEIR